MTGTERFVYRRRRMPKTFVLSAVLLLSCCSARSFVDSFSFQRLFGGLRTIRFNAEQLSLQTTKHLLSLSTSPETESDEQDTWSRRASSSPLKVRNRVRAVLKRARNRTGIRNSSEDETVREISTQSLMTETESFFSLKDTITDAPFPVEKKNGRTDYSKGLSPPDITLPDIKLPDITSPQVSENIKQASKVAVSDSLQPKGKKDPKSSPAAVVVEPLPFTLPKLTDDQRRLLAEGERIQEQSKMGNEGSGYVVVDVKAPPYVVWECLLDFESYPETIPTVRDMKLFTSTHLKEGYESENPVLAGTGRETRHYGTPSTTRAAFILSKFRFNIAAIHTYRPHPDGDYMIFTLDPSCTNVVLQSAKGIWYTQACPEGKEDYTRVWLLCELKVSWALPTFIVDYAARRAMPRATTWLKPQVEAAAELWLKERPNGDV